MWAPIFWFQILDSFLEENLDGSQILLPLVDSSPICVTHMHLLIHLLTQCFPHFSCSNKKQCAADLSLRASASLRTRSGVGCTGRSHSSISWPSSLLVPPSSPQALSLDGAKAGSLPHLHFSWQKHRKSNFLLRNCCKFRRTNCILPHPLQPIIPQFLLLGNSTNMILVQEWWEPRALGVNILVRIIRNAEGSIHSDQLFPMCQWEQRIKHKLKIQYRDAFLIWKGLSY